MSDKLGGAIFVVLVLLFGMSCFFVGYSVFGGANTKSIHLVNARATRTIPLVAIDSRGNGVMSELTVEIGVGEGRALVNINDVLADYSAQRSARYAMAVASDYVMEDLSYTDVIFTIESGAELVSGPSAGAAMAAALIATLEDAELRNNVMLTGTVGRDGNIGPVGGVLAKARAAKEYGAVRFLVPIGQSQDCELEEVCEVEDNLETCELVCSGDYVSVSDAAGIKVTEVGTIGEAVGYLLEG